MLFTVKLLGGKDDTATIELLPDVQVRHLKMKIADEMLLPYGSFKVLNAGKPLLDDDSQLLPAGLKEGAKLTVVLNTGDMVGPCKADSDSLMEIRVKAILGDSATPLNNLRLRKSIQNYVDFMSLDDLERYSKKVSPES
ncbi:hypothetical protein V3C99_006549 [Haemonchus contortus]